MNAEQLNAFIKAIQYTFNTSLGACASRKGLNVLKPGQPRAKVGGIPGRNWAIATVNLAGTAQGCLVMTLPEKTAIPLVAGLVGDRIGEMSPLVRDGIAEIAETIAGAACGCLGAGIHRSGPANVVVDETVHLKLPSNLPSFEIGFATGYGDFTVDVALS